MMYDSFKDRIDADIKKARDQMKYLPEENREEIINIIQNFAYQWACAEAHIKILCVCAGMMGHSNEEEFDPENADQLSALEGEGSVSLLSQMGLPIYSGLVSDWTMKFLGDAFYEDD